MPPALYRSLFDVLTASDVMYMSHSGFSHPHKQTRTWSSEVLTCSRDLPRTVCRQSRVTKPTSLACRRKSHHNHHHQFIIMKNLAYNAHCYFLIIRFDLVLAYTTPYFVQYSPTSDFLIQIIISSVKNKLSYCWETVRRESMPRIAEVDVEMTT